MEVTNKMSNPATVTTLELEALRTNADMARLIIDRFAQMLVAAAALMRAAEHGARAALPENATDVLPPLEPQTLAHFIVIQSALEPEEAKRTSEIVRNLGAAELRTWFGELSKLPVSQAVQSIRSQLFTASAA